MLTNINPKLPMRDKIATNEFYVNKLGFQNFGNADFDGYLMVEKDNKLIFIVNLKASKADVRRAVQTLYEVKVSKVNALSSQDLGSKNGGGSL
jgi:hypothetical protein